MHFERIVKCFFLKCDLQRGTVGMRMIKIELAGDQNLNLRIHFDFGATTVHRVISDLRLFQTETTML